MENAILRQFNLEDLQSISNILETDFDDFWNYNTLKNDIESTISSSFCYIINNQIIGFASISIILDIAELNNIVIRKSCRGNGYSSILLKYLIDFAKSKNCNKINLEVSAINNVAIKLYKKFGFKQVGIRHKYYNGIDALLFTLELI